MPFKRKREWEFPWEKEANEGREFIASISAHDARTYWFLALEKVQYSGVLVVLNYDKPVGIMGSPLILLEILQDRRAGKSEQAHRDIEIGLSKAVRVVELENKPKHTEPPATFLTRTIDVRSKPKSIVMLLQQFDAVAVTYRQRQIRAFCISLPVLVHAWTDADRTDQLLNWMRDVIKATAEPLWAW
jgi:hypothetical protein